jgi:hypothetical protein
MEKMLREKYEEINDKNKIEILSSKTKEKRF